MPESKNNDDWWTRPEYQLLVLAGVVVVVAVLVVAFATIGSPRKDTLPYDARYFAIQFLLLTTLGAVVAFLIDLERRTREAREQGRKFEIETVSSMLDQLDEIYSSVKKSRRMLRVDFARAQLSDTLLERMLSVNHDQEEAERLTRRLQALDAQMPSLAAIAPHVKQLDDYLSSLWDRFEESPTPGEWLEPFTALAGSGRSNFEKFKTPYDDAVKS